MKHLLLGLFLFPVALFGQSFSAFKDATAFVYKKDSLGNPVPAGTCFLIAKYVTNDTSRFYTFFVTAKHVLQDKDGSLLKEFYIRMNTKDSNSRFIYYKIDTSEKNRSVFFHKDSSVDLAVFLYSPKKDDYNYKVIPESFIPDRASFKKFNIEEGSEAFFAGLFVPYAGDHKIFPIFRFGHISLVTDEKIMWVGEKREMILLEISSYGGNSGAPVYVKLQQQDGSIRVILLGILSGTFRDIADIAIIQTNSTPVALYNNGISGVVPAYFLNEIIFSTEFNKILGL